VERFVVSDTILLQRRVLAATALSYVVVILDTSIVNVALERIADVFETGISGLQWVVNAYTLSFASLVLTGGALGDRLGARRIYLTGLGVFTLASALCGIAPGLPMLITARVLQGAGAAMLVPCALSLINQAYPDPRRRAAAIGVWAASGGIAMAAGPLVGGVLIHLLGWRGIFLVNLPIGLVGIWLAARIGTEAQAVPERQLDLAGQAFAIVALGSLIAVVIEGPVLGWSSLLVLMGLASSVFAWAAFIRLEARREHPMLPLGFFRGRVFTSSVLVSMVSALTFYGLVFTLSLYLQGAQGLTPLRTGLVFLPLTALVTAGSLLSDRIVRAYGPRRSICVAFIAYGVGFLALIAAPPGKTVWSAALALPLIGFAAGLITPATTAAMMGTVEKDRAGVAAGVMNAARQTGAALGVAVFGALVGASETFITGLHSALWGGAGLSLLVSVIWWIALGAQTRSAGRTAMGSSPTICVK
jgi:DHA2 family methylenomycin A resistance protein-like MFS transporter